jgi:hypothetical protein
MRRHDESLLQGRGGSMHNARPNDRVPLELDGQSLQEGVALQRVDRRCGRPNGVVLVVRKAERRVLERGQAPVP